MQDQSDARSDEDGVENAGPLTRRELEVARLITIGLTSRAIAKKLFISERTAEGHVERIRNKLDVRSRTGIATWMIRAGLCPSLEGDDPMALFGSSVAV